MNIPSIESLLSELDNVKAERNEWRKDCHTYADSLRRREDAISELRAERDEFKKECDIQCNLRIGVEHGFDCANEELGRYKAYVEQLKEEVQRWKYSAENPKFDGRFDTWQAVAGKYRAEMEELTAERNDLEKECQARSPLLMVLAVIREITGTQKEDGDATIAAVKKLVSEVDYWKTIRQENAEYFEKREAELIKERDELKSEIASEQRWASFYAQESLGRKAEIDTLKSALREAKEALIPYIKFVDGTQVKNHPAQVYERINKVLGEE